MENAEEILKKQRVSVGKRLKELRGDKGQKELAEMLNIGQSAYSAKERGEDSLTPEQIQILMDYFNVSYAWLTTGEETEKSTPIKNECYHLEQRVIAQSEEIAFLRRQLETRNVEFEKILQVIAKVSEK